MPSSLKAYFVLAVALCTLCACRSGISFPRKNVISLTIVRINYPPPLSSERLSSDTIQVADQARINQVMGAFNTNHPEPIKMLTHFFVYIRYADTVYTVCVNRNAINFGGKKYRTPVDADALIAAYFHT